MCLHDPEAALQVRCPHCREIDWRTPIELAAPRPFTCYICLCGCERPLMVERSPAGCAARLRKLCGAMCSLFRSRRPGTPV